jgi:hypothetical protein
LAGRLSLQGYLMHLLPRRIVGVVMILMNASFGSL